MNDHHKENPLAETEALAQEGRSAKETARHEAHEFLANPPPSSKEKRRMKLTELRKDPDHQLAVEEARQEFREFLKKRERKENSSP